jgi:hypothetical protein
MLYKKLVVAAFASSFSKPLLVKPLPPVEPQSIFVQKLIDGHLHKKWRWMRRGGAGIGALSGALALRYGLAGSSLTKDLFVPIVYDMGNSKSREDFLQNIGGKLWGQKGFVGLNVTGAVALYYCGLYLLKDFLKASMALDPSAINTTLDKTTNALLLDLTCLGEVTVACSAGDLINEISKMNTLLERFGSVIFTLQALTLFEKQFAAEGFNFRKKYASPFTDIGNRLASRIQVLAEIVLDKVLSLAVNTSSSEGRIQQNSVKSQVVINITETERMFGGKYSLCTADQVFGELQNLLGKVRSQALAIRGLLGSIYNLKSSGHATCQNDNFLTSTRSLDLATELLVRLHKVLRGTAEFVQEVKAQHADNIAKEELAILDAQKQKTLSEVKEKNAEAERREAEAKRLDAEKTASYVTTGMNVVGGIADLIAKRPVGTQGIHVDLRERTDRQ